ncbi:MAG TPA: hypothetical protein VGO30_00800 [Mycobacterium sp.]|nr:hypothetical protein [Mycobacterium sp.]
MTTLDGVRAIDLLGSVLGRPPRYVPISGPDGAFGVLPAPIRSKAALTSPQSTG